MLYLGASHSWYLQVPTEWFLTVFSIAIYYKLDHCIMQFKEFDWLSGHGI